MQSFNATSSIFYVPPKISSTAKIIFVADAFSDEYVGGAELTSQAIIDASPVEVCRLKCRDVNLQALEMGADRFWIFGNFSTLNPNLIPTITTNLKYAVIEYDYKYCKFRSPEKHQMTTGLPCDCHNQLNGKMVSAFYHGAQVLWWMSEKQKERYEVLFPFLSEKTNIVLSSVFDDVTLGKIKLLRSTIKSEDKRGWIILGSNSWIKGTEDARQWCVDKGYSYSVLQDLPYEHMLARIASAEGLVYLPKGGDTCPRLVIEAKLLGCKLQLNDNVQHAQEEWFNTDDTTSILEYLYAAREIFWKTTINLTGIRQIKISGYTTTFNCVAQQYPFLQSIKSMLKFCDEVCIVDGGSTDDTLSELAILKYPRMAHAMTGGQVPMIYQFNFLPQLIAEGFPDTFNAAWHGDPRIKIKVIKRDWNHPRFAVFDGEQKAEARRMCTGDICWQMDSDEMVHELDASKIRDIAGKLPPTIDILSLPVVEYWGSNKKVRIDVPPAKWRISRNSPHITHGIPMNLRRYDRDGNVYAAPGTDGCDMIDTMSGQPVPHATFVTPDVEMLRQRALTGDAAALEAYGTWFNNAVNAIPGVFHYSWYDIERKIKLYRKYWTRHWCSLYDMPQDDTAASNMMFNKPWSNVTDEDISILAKTLADKLGGWIWHKKWDGNTITPHVWMHRPEPEIMTHANN